MCCCIKILEHCSNKVITFWSNYTFSENMWSVIFIEISKNNRTYYMKIISEYRIKWILCKIVVCCWIWNRYYFLEFFCSFHVMKFDNFFFFVFIYFIIICNTNEFCCCFSFLYRCWVYACCWNLWMIVRRPIEKKLML